MSIMEVSIMHHVVIVLFGLWLLSFYDRSHPVAYFVSLIYLYLVHERYVMRLRRKVHFEERKQCNQRRVLSDSESVRWLNHAVEKMWPICMEQIASQKILLPIIPWFLEKYKPWTAKEALVQHLYLGRNPPMFTEMRVLRGSTDDDHLVLELGMNFVTADDMSAILAVKLRKRLGFGMWAKLHLTGMHIEGKVLIGVKFLRRWPFLGRLRVCFAEPPYFQMNVKPIFTHGLDVTELPGIAGWLDKLLSIAFEQSLVEPNMLVVDVEKFTSPEPENWFSVDVKEPIAYVKVEVVEAADVKPADLNGLSDPYVKGQLGPYKFKTKIQWKTLSPKWNEEYKIPICTWESPNVLSIEVLDKDHIFDDTLGDCTININDLRDGQRHDMWLPLQHIKMGRLHLIITVVEENAKEVDNSCDGETLNKEGVESKEDQGNKEDVRDSFANGTAHKGSFSDAHKNSFSPRSSEKSPKMADNFEPINVEGQQETGIWVHHPGSEISRTWEPRKAKSKFPVSNDSFGNSKSATSGPLIIESSSTDENPKGHAPPSSFRRGLRKIGSVFHRSPKTDDNSSSFVLEDTLSPRTNLKPVNTKESGVNLIMDNSISGSPTSSKASKERSVSWDQSDPESKNMKGVAKSILKHAEKHARSLKHALSRKGSRKSRGDSSGSLEHDIHVHPDTSDDDSLSSARVSAVSNQVSSSGNDTDSCSTKERVVTQRKKAGVEGHESKDNDKVADPKKRGGTGIS